MLQSIVFDEVELTLFVPEEKAIREMYQSGKVSFPYWSQVWPASKALAQFLLLHPEYTSGKQVLEIGAGLGLPSLAAAQHAASVLCTDYVPEAVAIAGKSAQHRHLQNFASAVLDWSQVPDDLKADVLLLSDINYEPSALTTLLQLIHRFLNQHAMVILSTPQRLMAKEFILSLLPFCSAQEQAEVEHMDQQVSVSILVLQK